MAVAAAEPYTDLFLAYSAAQGIASQHVTVVVGPSSGHFLKNLMGRATEAEEEKEVDIEAMQRMKIAWRYDQLQRVDTPLQERKEGTSPFLPSLLHRV